VSRENIRALAKATLEHDKEATAPELARFALAVLDALDEAEYAARLGFVDAASRRFAAQVTAAANRNPGEVRDGG